MEVMGVAGGEEGLAGRPGLLAPLHRPRDREPGRPP